MSRIDSIIATGVGRAHAVKAQLGGLVGVFRTLAKQHGEVGALMKRLRDKADKCDDLWPEIRRELISHERAELKEVYPVLRAHAELTPLADRHQREADEMEAKIQELDAQVDRDQFMAGFGELADAVLRHAAEEEQQIFPVAQRAIGEVRAKELDAPFLAAKKQIANAV